MTPDEREDIIKSLRAFAAEWRRLVEVVKKVVQQIIETIKQVWPSICRMANTMRKLKSYRRERMRRIHSMYRVKTAYPQRR